MLRNIMEKFKRKNTKKNSTFEKRLSRYHSSRRLSLEHLEPRELLSGTYTWTGGGSNNFWSNPNNWLGHVAPSGSDNTLYFNRQENHEEMNNDLPSSVTFSYIGFSVSGYIIDSSSPIYLSTSGSIYGNTASDIYINTSLVLPAGDNQIAMTLGSYLTISGKITGSGILDVNGTNTVTLSNANNDYTGGTYISAGTLKTTVAGALPSNTIITFGHYGGSGTLDLFGTSQTVAGISAVGIYAGNQSITNSSASNASLTVNGTSFSFGGVIEDAIGGIGSKKTSLTSMITGGGAVAFCEFKNGMVLAV
jgi:autotransporter-associated beta strand protein